jgi:hypothetical protein
LATAQLLDAPEKWGRTPFLSDARRFLVLIKLLELADPHRRVSRIGRQELLDARRRQRFREAHAQQLVAPVAAQVPGHHFQPGERVDRLPAFKIQADKKKLRRQDRPHAEEGVDARGIGVELVSRVLVEMREICLRRAPHAHGTQKAVGFQAAAAQRLGQAPGPDAPVNLHLPEAVLRMHEAERELRIALRLGEDVRHAEAVAQDLHRRAEAGELDLALPGGQRLAQVKEARPCDKYQG